MWIVEVESESRAAQAEKKRGAGVRLESCEWMMNVSNALVLTTR